LRRRLVDAPLSFAVFRAYAKAEVLDHLAFLRIAEVTAPTSI
jgi:hypothetical protein